MDRNVGDRRTLRHHVTQPAGPIRDLLIVPPVRLTPVGIRSRVFPGPGPGGVVEAVFVVQVRSPGVIGGEPAKGLFGGSTPSGRMEPFQPDPWLIVKTSDGRGNLRVIVIPVGHPTFTPVVIPGRGKPALGPEIVDVRIGLALHAIPSPVIVTG